VTGWKAGDPSAGRAGQSNGSGARYLLRVTDPVAAAPAVTRALVGSGADVLSITETRHSLEDVYLQMIEKKESRS
jgi:ABC-2 type transport system ATP-binding protein